MPNYTLGELQTLVRQRADMENNSFISDLELTNYINDSVFEAYEIIVNVTGGEALRLTADIQATPSGVAQINVSVYKLHLLQYRRSDGIAFPLRRRELQDVIYDTTQVDWNQLMRVDYWLSSNADSAQVVVLPPPSSTSTLQMTYVPYPTVASTASTTQPMTVAGWHEYVIIDSAIKCKEKEESDTTALERAKERFIQRIEMRTARFDHQHIPIADVHALDGDELDGGLYEEWF